MCAKKIKARADQLVFEQGLTESREQAKRLIMAGEVTLIDPSSSAPAVVVDKPGHIYLADSIFALTGKEQYVSRGAYKLLTILEAFSLDVSNFVCLDAGASTGGFTDCLLQRGASKVYAVDVGKNQLHEKLKADPRVINLEGINLRSAPASLIPEPVDLIVADVSFISLTLVLAPCLTWLKQGGLVAVLIKPQFELGPHETVKGVVRDEAARQRAVEKIVHFADEELNLEKVGVLPAAIKGPKGNQEYMALFRRKNLFRFQDAVFYNALCPECRICCGPQKEEGYFPMKLLNSQISERTKDDFALLNEYTAVLTKQGCKAFHNQSCSLERSLRPIACNIFPFVLIEKELFLYRYCPATRYEISAFAQEIHRWLASLPKESRERIAISFSDIPREQFIELNLPPLL